MAAGAFIVYQSFREHLGKAAFNLGTDAFKLALFTSASNAGDLTLSTLASLDNEVATEYGYSASGQTIVATWLSGASAGEWRFDMTSEVFTAAGGDISAVKFAVIHDTTATKLIAVSQLSTSEFSITDTNTLTITPTANGVFELN